MGSNTIPGCSGGYDPTRDHRAEELSRGGRGVLEGFLDLETLKPGLEGYMGVSMAQRRKGFPAEETIVCMKAWPLDRDKELCVTANEEGKSETRKTWSAQPTRTCCSSHRPGDVASLILAQWSLSDQWDQIRAPQGSLSTVRQHHLCAAPGPCTPVPTAGA